MISSVFFRFSTVVEVAEDLISFTDLLVLRLLNNSFEEMVAFQKALRELVTSADSVYAKQHEEFFVGLEGRLVILDSFLCS